MFPAGVSRRHLLAWVGRSVGIFARSGPFGRSIGFPAGFQLTDPQTKDTIWARKQFPGWFPPSLPRWLRATGGHRLGRVGTNTKWLKVQLSVSRIGASGSSKPLPETTSFSTCRTSKACASRTCVKDRGSHSTKDRVPRGHALRTSALSDGLSRTQIAGPGATALGRRSLSCMRGSSALRRDPRLRQGPRGHSRGASGDAG